MRILIIEDETILREEVVQWMELEGYEVFSAADGACLELLQAVRARLEKKAAHGQIRKHDVEQWQQAFEHEREQRQLIAKLVAMFSHDFRNPLAAILSSISIVRDYADHVDEQRRRKHLNRAEASVEIVRGLAAVAIRETS